MDNEKMEDIMLPGFRFHPTDEELVGFYLKRKIQQRPLTIELIKQLDIYKYDPWDLPKLATTGEKEWYFYCPRDRKYRNSARPNRVTGAGFWKATGTDRPIYASEGSKCIGLKKSLVFYKGRAAKGAKTDWMMHEFRLPSLNDSSSAPKRFLDKTIPPNDSWAICRIFKKTNSSAQRALSQSWVSPPPQNMTSSSSSTKPPMLDPFSSYNKSNAAAATTTTNNNNPLMSCPYNTTTTNNNISSVMINGHDLSSSSTFVFSPLLDHQSSAPPRCDVSSVLLNMSSKVLGDYGGSYDDGLVSFGGLVQGNGGSSDEMEMNGGMMMRSVGDRGDEQQWIGFPMSGYDSWRSGWVWEASPCPSEMSTTTTKCYT